MKFTKAKKRQMLDVGAGAGLVFAMTGVGIVVGMAFKKALEKLRGPNATAFVSGDPVLDAAKNL